MQYLDNRKKTYFRLFSDELIPTIYAKCSTAKLLYIPTSAHIQKDLKVDGSEIYLSFEN